MNVQKRNNMKCDNCGKNEATVHLTEVINDNITKLHLCETCARTKSEEMQSHFGLTDLLSGLMDFEPGMTGEAKHDLMTKCPGCGMTYFDFQHSGRLGCGACYEVFSKNLNELLRKIHGSDKHVGKMPFKGKDVLKKQEDLQRLKGELRDLVRAEEFEKASVLRDRIKDMEGKLGGA